MVLVSIYERASTAFNQFVNFKFFLSSNDAVFKIFAGFFVVFGQTTTLLLQKK